MSDQNRFSPYNTNAKIKQASDKKKEKRKTSIWRLLMIKIQILQTNTILIVLQTVRRKSNEILGVKGFKRHNRQLSFSGKIIYLKNVV